MNIEHSNANDHARALRAITWISRVLTIALVYFLSARAGFNFSLAGGQVTPIWPPTGISVACMFLFGVNVWPGVLLGAFVSNLSTGAPALVDVGIAFGNTSQALLAYYLLTRVVSFDPALKRLSDVMGLVVCGSLLSTLSSSSIGASCLYLGGLLPASRFDSYWLTWWLGDAMGVLLFAPLLLVLSQVRELRLRRIDLFFLVVMLTGLMLTSYVLFGENANVSAGSSTLVFLVFPFLIWAALQFGQLGVSVSVALLASIAVWGTARGYGPFAGTDVNESLLLLMTFFGVSSLTGLTLSAILSERTETWKLLRESERRLSTLLSNLPGMAYRRENDSDWTMQFVSEGAWELTGFRPSHLIGNSTISYGSLIASEDRQRVWEACQESFASGRPFQGQYRIYTAAGSEKWVWEQSQAVIGHNGELLFIEGFISDITERKELEERYFHAQRLESVGKLAGGVAHDFNNLLTAILGYVDLALFELPLDDDRRNDFENIGKAAQSASTLTQQLLAYARKQMIRPLELDLNEVIMRTVQLLRPLIGENVEVVASLAHEPQIVHADQGQIEQVLMNLCLNARDAMPRGGKLSLRTRNLELLENGRDRVADLSELPPGSYTVMTVTDTGMGMDGNVLAHVFEPFFTTKELGKGTGLGLATCYGIVKQNGGHITVESEINFGTTFTIFFPSVRRLQLATGEIAFHPAQHDQISGTVLVVEDDPFVRGVAVRALRMHGYIVLEASSGSEALQLAASYTGEIQLLLTDVVMPGISGAEVARRMILERPRMRVLYTSGYTEAGIVSEGVLASGIAFLSKPFKVDVLLEKVREVLGENQGSETGQAVGNG